MKSYLSVFRMRWRMELQYRGAVVGGFFCQVFFGLILVALYRALYQSKPQAMPVASVTTYVWLQQAFFRMLLASDADLLDKIRSGSIAYDLCRPLNLYGYYYARILAQKLLGSLMRAAPMFIFAALLPAGWGLSAPVSLSALLVSVAGLLLGLCCVCALENITMAITMRTLDSRGVQAMLNLLMMTFSGNILPLTLFPDSWQKVITLLPYAQLLDAPIRLYTGEWPLSEAPRVLALQAAWTIALVGLGLLLWKRHQKKLVIQGG
ncbi:MAG: ABC-2 family transporter protein [Clostridia bacterium]|nr:ABC-2 family transporter protein [Clostridia bacterium]MBR0408388.1 ABC-2 family transporter protein [Clostridia bacterium]